MCALFCRGGGIGGGGDCTRDALSLDVVQHWLQLCRGIPPQDARHPGREIAHPVCRQTQAFQQFHLATAVACRLLGKNTSIANTFTAGCTAL